MEKLQRAGFLDSSEDLSFMKFASSSVKKCCILLDPTLRSGT